MFNLIEIRDWRQFASVRIEFHDKLTVLTGANGTGKTTILNLLNRHFGWNLQLVGNPRVGKKGVLKFFSDLWKYRNVLSDATPETGEAEIGIIGYGHGNEAKLRIPHEVGSQYQVKIAGMREVAGVFVPSHRPIYAYQQVEQIPTLVSASEELLERYMNEVRNRYNANSRVHSASYRLKEALISLATFGYGNQVVEKNPEAIASFEKFQKVLARVLPSTLGFRNIQIRMPEVVLNTRSGQFSLDAVSGGISAIIDMAWQIHLASQVHDSFAVVIDEPENHLHPTLQKTVLPNLLSAFPNVQFIIATHNPFMVSSVPDSNVYVLDYNSKQPSRVESTKLDMVNMAGSSNEILREVLGLDHTKPLWVERKITELVDKYSGGEFTEHDLSTLRTEMKSLQLDHLFPETLSRIRD